MQGTGTSTFTGKIPYISKFKITSLTLAYVTTRTYSMKPADREAKH